MKKLFIVFFGIILSGIVSAQKPFSGFFFDVNQNPLVVKSQGNDLIKFRADSSYNIHLVRFNAGLGGVQILYNKATKEFKAEPFAKVGVGLTYSFYSVSNGEAFNYLSLNGFLFLPMTDLNTTMSVAVTVSAFKLFGTNLSPSLGVNFEPSLINSDYVPVGPIFNLKYNF